MVEVENLRGFVPMSQIPNVRCLTVPLTCSSMEWCCTHTVLLYSLAILVPDCNVCCMLHAAFMLHYQPAQTYRDDLTHLLTYRDDLTHLLLVKSRINKHFISLRVVSIIAFRAFMQVSCQPKTNFVHLLGRLRMLMISWIKTCLKKGSVLCSVLARQQTASNSKRTM